MAAMAAKAGLVAATSDSRVLNLFRTSLIGSPSARRLDSIFGTTTSTWIVLFVGASPNKSPISSAGSISTSSSALTSSGTPPLRIAITAGSFDFSHAPSFFARESCRSDATTLLNLSSWINFSLISSQIAFFKSSTKSFSSTRTENALPATPTIAHKSFTIFPRAGRFWNEEEGRENFWRT
ncbi:unnamed protein product [Phytophthora lilii]|uniref:Unnamed protein product n=1 Tax=Phytophthora lilii TaxID=2077276 RepID=A0A9W6Y4M1_9STRA|nr:unnamed protein product [Phytophthora lilii]